MAFPSLCVFSRGKKSKGQQSSLKCLANDLPESGPHKSCKMLYFNNRLEKLFSAMMKPSFKIYGFISEMDYKKRLT